MSRAETLETLQALEGLLRWYAAMGVDATIDGVAHDRFVAAPEPRAAVTDRGRMPQDEPARREAGPVSSATLVADAETLAREAKDIDDLAARWAELPGCSLATSAARMVLATGTPGARVMLIAGAPEADDERAGAAFAGPRGALLDAMLRAIGLDRSSVYLAHLLPWRPPGARAPAW